MSLCFHASFYEEWSPSSTRVLWPASGEVKKVFPYMPFLTFLWLEIFDMPRCHTLRVMFPEPQQILRMLVLQPRIFHLISKLELAVIFWGVSFWPTEMFKDHCPHGFWFWSFVLLLPSLQMWACRVRSKVEAIQSFRGQIIKDLFIRFYKIALFQDEGSLACVLWVGIADMGVFVLNTGSWLTSVSFSGENAPD